MRNSVLLAALVLWPASPAVAGSSIAITNDSGSLIESYELNAGNAIPDG